MSFVPVPFAHRENWSIIKKKHNLFNMWPRPHRTAIELFPRDFRFSNHFAYNSIYLLTIILALCTIQVAADRVESPINYPFWRETDEWSDCTTSCGPGVQTRIFQCVNRDIYDVFTVLPDDRCSGQSYPNPTTGLYERPCDYGPCQGYRWRVSSWGPCSQTCGGFGTMTRDVECIYGGQDEDIVLSDYHAQYYCGHIERPERHSPCNRMACPPEFVPEQWGKCIQTDPCRPGRQVRQVSCISIQVNGTYRQLPRAACYLLGRPQQPTWRRCFVASLNTCKGKQPTIDEDSVTIVQMRKAKLLNLQVGQRAFVIPYTRLSVRCPVHYYSVHEIIWTHPNHGSLKYTGPVNNRISVDRRGRLRIRSFRNADSGTWQCIAGNQQAEVSLTPRTPAEGFHDWVQRNRLWTKGMMSDDPKDMAAVHAIVQWVEGPWSACSVGCGDTGQQFRTVRCERVDTRFYQILDDKACLDKLLPKPMSKRKCLKSKTCPTWVVDGADSNVCTDNCLAVDQGSIKGNLTCRIGNRVMEESMCDNTEKPDMSCPNPKCQVKWDIGSWSQCSKICGGVGVRARQLNCIWVHDKRSAGSLCYANQIPSPAVIEECEAPPCKFECVDFSKHCSKKLELCKFTLYRYQCCASCKNYAFGLQDSRN